MTLHGVVNNLMILSGGPARLNLVGVIRVMSEEPIEVPLRAEVRAPSGLPVSPPVNAVMALPAYKSQTYIFPMEVLPEEVGIYRFVVEVDSAPAASVPVIVQWAPDARPPDISGRVEGS